MWEISVSRGAEHEGKNKCLMFQSPHLTSCSSLLASRGLENMTRSVRYLLSCRLVICINRSNALILEVQGGCVLWQTVALLINASVSSAITSLPSPPQANPQTFVGFLAKLVASDQVGFVNGIEQGGN